MGRHAILTVSTGVTRTLLQCSCNFRTHEIISIVEPPVAASQALPINLDDQALLAQLQRDQSPLAGRNDRSGPHSRESDLLAFEITIERSQPGSVKGGCYDKINGDYAGGNKVLLEDVLKGARGLRDVRLGRDPEMGVRAQIFPVRLTNAS